MPIHRYQTSDWENMGQRTRTTFLNTVSGFKNAVLIGTADPEGHTNLAIFNSIVHIGADPALLGFILRPTTVPRHTYDNILASRNYTFNLITTTMAERAHRTSAKFPREVSEFDACQLHAHWEDSFQAPFVEESPVRIGLQYEEEHAIRANGTLLIIGRVVELHLPQEHVGPDGFVDLESLDIVCTNGLDAYFSPRLVNRFPYARP